MTFQDENRASILDSFLVRILFSYLSFMGEFIQIGFSWILFLISLPYSIFAYVWIIEEYKRVASFKEVLLLISHF